MHTSTLPQILVIFAEDRAYAYDWKIFPQISSLVFDRMTVDSDRS